MTRIVPRRVAAGQATALLATALLAGCSPPENEQAVPSAVPSAKPEPSPSASETPGRMTAYTSLEGCPILEQNPDEAGYYLSECPGAGGYKVRVIEFDLRQTVEVVPPDGVAHGLELAAVTGGGFSTLGKTAEWRGPRTTGAFAPDALILRHEVVTDPEGKITVSYLVVVSVAGEPCVTARIAPGSGQNAKARAAADAGGACLAPPS